LLDSGVKTGFVAATCGAAKASGKTGMEGMTGGAGREAVSTAAGAGGTAAGTAVGSVGMETMGGAVGREGRKGMGAPGMLMKLKSGSVGAGRPVPGRVAPGTPGLGRPTPVMLGNAPGILGPKLGMPGPYPVGNAPPATVVDIINGIENGTAFDDGRTGMAGAPEIRGDGATGALGSW